MGPEGVPFPVLVLEELEEDVVAEGLAHELTLGDLLERLEEAAGQRDDPRLFALFRVHLEDVLFHGLGQLVLFLDTLDAGRDHDGEGEIRVAGRIGRAEFYPGGLGLARLVHRDPDHGGAVSARPGDIDRGLVARYQPLVGVHPLAADSRDFTRMSKDACDVMLAGGGELVLVLGIEEGVLAALEQGLVHVHAAAVLAEDGLGHEGGVDAVLSGDLLDRGAIGHDHVGHEQGLLVFKVDLMLGGRNLMMAVLDRDAHLLESKDGVPSNVRAPVDRQAVKVAAAVEGLRGALIGKVEVLQFRTHVDSIAHVGNLLEGALQCPARTAFVRGAVRVHDVAEHTRNGAVARPPGDELEGRGVRLGDHVALVDAGKALDGRPVEAHALLQTLVELGWGDVEALEPAQNIGEPELNEADILLFDNLEYILFRFTCQHSLHLSFFIIFPGAI